MTEATGAVEAGGTSAAPASLDTPVPPVLAAAVVAAWAELDNVTKTKTANVGSYSYEFSDLAGLLDLARPILAKHGLALLQPITRDLDGPLEIDTWLLHTSGHLLRWRFETPAPGTPQATGSAITYARRYCGQAALGIASEGADDDGKAATAAADVTPPRQTVPERTVSAAADRARRQAMVLFGRLGIRDRDERNRLTGLILNRTVESWNDLSGTERARVISELQVRLDADDEVDGRAARLDLEADDAGY